jgi:beta-glucanase (GH16 family)
MSAEAGPDVQNRPAPDRRPRGRTIAIVVAVVVAVVVAAVGYAVYRLLTPAEEGGWETVWRDDFDGAKGELPSSSEWLLDTGTSYPGGAPQWGTGEIQTYAADPANVQLDGDGHLQITATRDQAGTWRSARLETRRTDFQPEPGGRLKVEADIRVPDGGPGYWAAFWMLGEPFRGDYQNWPGVGEIDIMEFKGGVPADVYGTFHCGVAPGGPCNENNGIGGHDTSPDGPLHQDFHTYAVEWDRSTSPEEIRWYVDGRQFHAVKASDVDQATWEKATDHGYFVLLNLAVGGAFGGPPDDSTQPGRSMVVDHVTVSRR